MKSLSRVVKSFQVSLGEPYQFNRSALDSKDMDVRSQKIESDIEASLEKQAHHIIGDAHNEAQQIINDAKKTAGKVLDEARKEIEEMRATALEEAREQGYNEGYAEVSSKAEHVLKEAEEIRQNAQQEYQSLMQGAEKQIVQIILEVAKKVIGDELSTRDERVSSLVIQAIKECTGTTSVVVKVAPEDYDAVNSQIEQIIKKSGYSGEIEIKKDPALDSGGCMVETPVGNIDAGFQVQMQAIEKAFYAVLANNDPVSS